MAFFRKQNESKENKIFTVFFFAGFLLGVFYGAFTGSEGDIGASVMNEYYFSRYACMQLDKTSLFVYVLRQRTLLALLIWILGMTVAGGLFVLGGLGWFGFSIGLVLSTAVRNLGLRGILLCVAAVIPHYFIYIPLMYFFLRKVYQLSVGRQLSLSLRAGMWKSKKYMIFNYVSMLFITLLGLLLVSLLESFLNPQILKIFVIKK